MKFIKKTKILSLFLLIFVFTLESFAYSEDNEHQNLNVKSTTINSTQLAELKRKLDELIFKSSVSKINYDNKITTLEEKVKSQDGLINILISKDLSLNASTERVSGYEKWTSILLGSVTVIITTLGVFIALLSFFGYREVIKRSEEIASNISAKEAEIKSQELVPEAVKQEIASQIEGGQLRKFIKENLEEIALRGILSGVDKDEDPDDEQL